MTQYQSKGMALNFRIKAFCAHLLASALVTTAGLSVLYLGWYQWPAWYLLGTARIAAILALVDIGLGPIATLVVANPAKPRTELRRDIAMIVALQVSALAFGMATLWGGRPLFYTYSVDRFEIVAASAIDEAEIEAARRVNPSLFPSLTSRPRWVWAPLPDNGQEREEIVKSALSGGKDVIAMPRYYRSFDQAESEIRAQLRSIDELRGLTKAEKELLAPEVAKIGPPEKVAAILFDGPSKSAVAVLDRNTLEIKAILKRER